MEVTKSSGNLMSDSTVTCSCCAQNHALEDCQQFNRMTHKDKMHFLKEKELCFGCLYAGHISRGCDKHLTCRICGKTHPSVLLIDKRDTKKGEAL